MKATVKSFVSAAVLALASAASHAAPAIELVPGEAWALFGLSDGWYTFDVAGSGSYSLEINADATGSGVIHELRLYSGADGAGSWLDQTNPNTKNVNWGYSFVSAGTYSLFVDVTPTGLYTGTIAAVAAVPEPETYAMMLAGLGAVGFMARRRKS